jgi:16S rRNA (adenine1518-N6/adenine1519-N6)-dimethyltransferase
MPRIKPKARFGQHFLMEKKYAARIVEALEPETGESIVEIGSGKGVLTDILLQKGCQVTAIELDKRLINLLNNKYRNRPSIKILPYDFLKINPSQIPNNSKILGNIPYNITSQILDKLFKFRQMITLAVLTVQAEVAANLSASSGDKGYGKSTVLLWAGFDIESLFTIPRSAFSPPPQVTSKVVRIRPANREIEDIESFRQFIRNCFCQKTKTLANSMQMGFDLPKERCEYLIQKAELDKKIRLTAVSCNDYLNLYRIWQETD